MGIAMGPIGAYPPLNEHEGRVIYEEDAAQSFETRHRHLKTAGLGILAAGAFVAVSAVAYENMEFFMEKTMSFITNLLERAE